VFCSQSRYLRNGVELDLAPPMAPLYCAMSRVAAALPIPNRCIKSARRSSPKKGQRKSMKTRRSRTLDEVSLWVSGGIT
jgi:hypothetical protein